MFKKIIFCLIILGSVSFSGCTDYYYEEETFVLESGYYTSYQFVFNEGDILEVSMNTRGGPVDVTILDSQNYYKFEDLITRLIENENYEPEYYYYYDLYFDNVISKNFEFIAPMDGEYYLVLQNLGNEDVTIDFKCESY